MKKIILTIIAVFLLTALVACGKEKTRFTVTFDSDGGNNISTQIVDVGMKVRKPQDPIKVGYFFEEWQLENTKFDFDSIIESDITLKASWESGINEDGTCTITFETDGGTKIPSVNVEQHSPTPKPQDPVKLGYDFVGWKSNDKMYDFGRPVTTHTTVTAIWAMNANEIDEDGNQYAILGDKTLILVKGVNTPHLEIKEEVNGYKVSKIGYKAFEGCNEIETINIEPHINEIGYGAFIGCNNIVSVVLPFVGESEDTLTNTHFGYIFGATSYNYNSTNIPRSLVKVTINNAKIIYKDAFFNCFTLKEIIITEDVEEIESSVFYACSSLYSITLPYIGDGKEETHFGYIFGASTAQQNDTFVPKSLKQVNITNIEVVDEYAFAFCSNIEEVNLPDKINSIKGYAFSGCLSLLDFNIPISTDIIEKYTFENCISLTSIHIPEQIQTIDDGAFKGCTSLTNVLLPKVEIVGDSAFSGCINLNVITMNCVEVIGSDAFSGCEKLTTIKMESIEVINSGAFADCVSLTSMIIPSKITIIESYVFSGCTNLATVTIHNKVKIINEGAFKGCISLTNVNIPSATYIGLSTFEGCINLASITLPSMGTHFGYIFGAISAINNHEFVVPSLKTVVFTNATEIALNAFYGCTSIVNITLPNTLETIGKGIFVDCTSLNTINVPFLGESINADNAYLGYFFQTYGTPSNDDIVPSLKTVNITNDITRIVDGAFINCNNLTTVNLPDSIVSVGEYAFKNMPNINNLNLKNTQSIGANAFEGCVKLKSLISEITVVEEYTFKDCISVTTFDFSKVSHIKEGAFANSGLTSAVISTDTLLEIGSFKDANKLNKITLPTIYSYIGYIFGGDNSLVPSSLKTVIVTEDDTIEDNAYKGCSYIVNVLYSQTIDIINTDTFKDCSSLIAFNIEEVTLIKTGAFENTGLTNVLIKEGVVIEEAAYKNTDKLNTITLPYLGNGTDISNIGFIFGGNDLVPSSLKTVNINNIDTIEENAFKDCAYIVTINLPTSVSSIGNSAFEGCSALTTVNNFNYDIVNTNVFKDCTSLSNFNFANITLVKEGAFDNAGLVNISMPSNTIVEKGAFKNLTKVTTLTTSNLYGYLGYIFGLDDNLLVPTSLKTINVKGVGVIEANTFKDCTTITTVTLTNTVSKLKQGAFEGCSALTRITLPTSITHIETNVFNGCSKLTITCQATSPGANWVGFTYDSEEECYKYENNDSIKINFA